MTPLDKEVHDFMHSLNFRYDGTVGVWLMIGLPPVKHEQATFFYTATKQAELKARIDELEMAAVGFVDIRLEKQVDYHNTRMAKLEVQLNQNKLEKG